jgi:hypothetical protein
MFGRKNNLKNFKAILINKNSFNRVYCVALAGKAFEWQTTAGCAYG